VTEARAHFRRTSDQVPAARRFVRETLTRWGETNLLGDAVLMASELFTNAVLHGRGEVEVGLDLGQDALRIEVLDNGRATPALRGEHAPLSTITGRGLRIIDVLASDWGDARDASGRTRVWVDVPRR
jgi:anti-sigma regulatory factor (Ser/Thr protein kinase)